MVWANLQLICILMRFGEDIIANANVDACKAFLRPLKILRSGGGVVLGEFFYRY